MEGIFRKQNSPLAVRFSLPIQARAVSLGPACQSLQKPLTSRKRRCSRGSSGHRCAFFVAPAPGRSVPDEACGPARVHRVVPDGFRGGLGDPLLPLGEEPSERLHVLLHTEDFQGYHPFSPSVSGSICRIA